MKTESYAPHEPQQPHEWQWHSQSEEAYVTSFKRTQDFCPGIIRLSL
jgi:hypothetical protein